jgi:hypothetical protein
MGSQGRSLKVFARSGAIPLMDVGLRKNLIPPLKTSGNTTETYTFRGTQRHPYVRLWHPWDGSTTDIHGMDQLRRNRPPKWSHFGQSDDSRTPNFVVPDHHKRDRPARVSSHVPVSAAAIAWGNLNQPQRWQRLVHKNNPPVVLSIALSYERHCMVGCAMPFHFPTFRAAYATHRSATPNPSN